MITTSIWMFQPYQAGLREEDLSPLKRGEVLVRTQVSAISSGTELLFYRGEFPTDVPIDDSIAALAGPSQYPLKYGYCTVGEIITCGPGVDAGWIGRRAFSFSPHTQFFAASLREILPVPEGIDLDDAVFLPNMETAVNLVMDGAPSIGEQVIVFGQGVVGLLTTALLGKFPLSGTTSLDKYPLRRAHSRRLGASRSIDPLDSQAVSDLAASLEGGADLIYELSAAPETLNAAIDLAGFEGRIVVGSWYGRKQVRLNLGGKFHRSRIKIISSQVSTIASHHSGRWGKARRFEVAWDMIREIKPSRLITHRFPFTEAEAAYRHLDAQPQETVQVVFDYDSV